MKTRLGLIIVASVLTLTAVLPAEAAAQYRVGPNRYPAFNTRPGVQYYPQVANSNIQATINYAYMNEMSKRAANSAWMIQPYYMMQPYSYNYSFTYTNGFNPFFGNPWGR